MSVTRAGGDVPDGPVKRGPGRPRAQPLEDQRRQVLDAALRVVSSGELPGSAGRVRPAEHRGRVEAYVFDQETAEADWIARQVEQSIAGGTDTDQVTVTATPPGAGTFITLLALYPTVNVLGPGVAVGTTLTLVAISSRP